MRKLTTFLLAAAALSSGAANADRYVSEDLSFMSLQLQCDGASFSRPGKCQILVDELKQRTTFPVMADDRTLLPLVDPDLKQDLGRFIEMRAANRDDELPKVSDDDAKFLRGFKAADPVCWSASPPQAVGFIWCAHADAWPEKMVLFVVGTGAALPVLMTKAAQ